MCKIACDQSEILIFEIFVSQAFATLHVLKAKYSSLEHLYLKHLLIRAKLHVIKVMAREDLQLWLLLESETAHLESQVNMRGLGGIPGSNQNGIDLETK